MKYALLSILILFLSSCGKPNKQLEISLNDSNNIKILNKRDSLALELIKLYGSDQIARENNRLFTGLDTINFDVLVDFVENNGFPNEKLLGEDYMKIEPIGATAGAVLLHNPHRLINEKEYFDLFLSEVEKGNMNREMLALVLDKYYWVRRDNDGNRKLLYGTQFGKPCLKYRKQSDSARATIGLKPLADSLFIKCF